MRASIHGRHMKAGPTKLACRTGESAARALLLVLALGSSAASAAGDGGWDFGAKLSYDRAEGTYGTQAKSRDASTTLLLSADSENYAFDLSLPYVAQTGPGRRIVLAGRRAVVIVENGRTAMGMGDVTLGATRYLLNEEKHGVDLDMGLSYKFGTASESKGLGTGKNDVAVQASLARSVGAATFSVTAGYTFVGKPEGQDLRNSAFASVDASVRLARGLNAGVTFGYGAPSVSGAPSSRDVTYYINYRLSKNHKLEVYVLDGHSTQSPDRGAGATFSVDF